MLWLPLLPAASPHAGAPLESIDVHVPAGEAVAIESSIGWLWAPDGEGFEWLCHEAITAPNVVRVPDYTVSDAGVMLGRVQDPSDGREPGEGLYRSEDGCDWQPAEGLSGRTLAAHALHPSDPSLAYVVTADVSENDLLRSEDGGASFSETALADVEATFTSVVVGPDGRVWAAAMDAEGQALVFTSVDGEHAWSRHAVEGEGSLRLLAAEVGAAWAGQGGVTAQRLLRLTEGGAQVEVRLDEDQAITDLALEEGGAVWVAAAGVGYLRAAPGGDFEPVEALPGLGLDIGRGQVWLATRFELTNIALAVGNPQAGFTPVFTLYDLTGSPARCGPETHVGAVCPGDWAALEPRLVDPRDSGGPSSGDDSAATVDTGGSTADKPCGCASGPGAGWGGPLGLALLALLRRAQRRS